jgi:hypothetical protein
MELERGAINIVKKFMGNKDITENQRSHCSTRIKNKCG